MSSDHSLYSSENIDLSLSLEKSSKNNTCKSILKNSCNIKDYLGKLSLIIAYIL
jgi:hypothetical protein